MTYQEEAVRCGFVLFLFSTNKEQVEERAGDRDMVLGARYLQCSLQLALCCAVLTLCEAADSGSGIYSIGSTSCSAVGKDPPPLTAPSSVSAPSNASVDRLVVSTAGYTCSAEMCLTAWRVCYYQTDKNINTVPVTFALLRRNTSGSLDIVEGSRYVASLKGLPSEHWFSCERRTLGSKCSVEVRLGDMVGVVIGAKSSLRFVGVGEGESVMVGSVDEKARVVQDSLIEMSETALLLTALVGNCTEDTRGSCADPTPTTPTTPTTTNTATSTRPTEDQWVKEDIWTVVVVPILSAAVVIMLVLILVLFCTILRRSRKRKVPLKNVLLSATTSPSLTTHTGSSELELHILDTNSPSSAHSTSLSPAPLQPGGVVDTQLNGHSRTTVPWQPWQSPTMAAPAFHTGPTHCLLPLPDSATSPSPRAKRKPPVIKPKPKHLSSQHKEPRPPPVRTPSVEPRPPPIRTPSVEPRPPPVRTPSAEPRPPPIRTPSAEPRPPPVRTPSAEPVTLHTSLPSSAFPQSPPVPVPHFKVERVPSKVPVTQSPPGRVPLRHSYSDDTMATPCAKEHLGDRPTILLPRPPWHGGRLSQMSTGSLPDFTSSAFLDSPALDEDDYTIPTHLIPALGGRPQPYQEPQPIYSYAYMHVMWAKAGKFKTMPRGRVQLETMAVKRRSQSVTDSLRTQPALRQPGLVDPDYDEIFSDHQTLTTPTASKSTRTAYGYRGTRPQGMTPERGPADRARSLNKPHPLAGESAPTVHPGQQNKLNSHHSPPVYKGHTTSSVDSAHRRCLSTESDDYMNEDEFPRPCISAVPPSLTVPTLNSQPPVLVSAAETPLHSLRTLQRYATLHPTPMEEEDMYSTPRGSNSSDTDSWLSSEEGGVSPHPLAPPTDKHYDHLKGGDYDSLCRAPLQATAKAGVL